MFYEPGRTEHNLPHDPFKACVVPRPIGWISTISPPSDASGKTDETETQHIQQVNNQGEAETGTPTTSHGRDQTTSRTANLAPYSQFNNLTFDPPYIMFSANQVLTPTEPSTDASSSTSASPSTPTPRIDTRKDTVRNAQATGVFCWQLATWALRDAVNKTAESLPYGVDEFEHAGLTKTYSRTLKVPVPMVAESPVRFECEYHSTLRLPGNPPLGTVDVVIGKVVGIHIDERVLTDGKIDVRKTQPIARCGYYDYAVVRETFEMIIPGNPAALYGLEGNVKQHQKHRDAAQKVKEVEVPEPKPS